MKIATFTFNPIQENTYLVMDDWGNAVIIDPGCYFEEERQQIREVITQNDLQLRAILNTHAHLDHICGNAFLKREYNADLYLHELDMPTLQMAKNSALMFGLNRFEESPQPDKFLKEGETLNFGDVSFEILFTPGHSPGHVVFYNKKEGFVINGDVLFQGSYGRVDLPGGNFEDLKKSITQKMFNLPEDTIVYTGHGAPTTIGREKNTNPILW